MVIATTQYPQTQSSTMATTSILPEVREVVAHCPGCKTLESVFFNGRWLMQTRKFSQQGEQVFHDCGTVEPCRLYRAYSRG